MAKTPAISLIVAPKAHPLSVYKAVGRMRPERRDSEAMAKPSVSFVRWQGPQRSEEAIMEALGYRGIGFTATGRAALLLDNDEWLVLSKAQGESLVRSRAGEGLPPSL